jgi:hypothetical protein
MLLQPLVTCIGVTVRAAATSMHIPVDSGTLTTAGDLDFRGMLGVKDEDGANVDVEFQMIGSKVALDVEAESKDKVDKLISWRE